MARIKPAAKEADRFWLCNKVYSKRSATAPALILSVLITSWLAAESFFTGFNPVATLPLATLLCIILVVFLWGLRRNRRIEVEQRSLDEALAVVDCVLDEMTEGVLIADLRKPGDALVFVNRAFERITGYRSDEAIGKNCRYLQGSDRLQPEISKIRDSISARRSVHLTLRNYRKDGRLFWNDLRLVPVFAPGGGREATHYVGIMNDVTETKEMRSRLEHEGHIDRLTLVANRYYFYDRVANLLRDSATTYVLVAKLDIAHFHEINTSYGYECGDLLLREVAQRLKSAWSGEIARSAADEFALAVSIMGPDEASAAIENLQNILRPKYVIPGAEIELRFAIGFIVGVRGADAMTLIRQAGVALQDSRRSRLREPFGFDSRTDKEIKRRVRLTHEVHQAVTGEDFVLFYQPKVNIDTGAIVGAEALIRWRHPVFGMQPPAGFIPIAEETGLILEIGAWVIREAALFAARLNRGRRDPLTISVNVSQIQFAVQDVCGLVASALRDAGASPSWITLELTESLLADGSPDMKNVFDKLRNLGVGLSIDDFGTGYSSLSYLDRFPISEIKIDRSFVEDLHRSRIHNVIVDALIKLGAELNWTVIAEGVETEEQRSVLQKLGCKYGQGFLFGRPLPSDEFLRLAQG